MKIIDEIFACQRDYEIYICVLPIESSDCLTIIIERGRYMYYKIHINRNKVIVTSIEKLNLCQQRKKESISKTNAADIEKRYYYNQLSEYSDHGEPSVR